MEWINNPDTTSDIDVYSCWIDICDLCLIYACSKYK